jgi:hypothetical protein
MRPSCPSSVRSQSRLNSRTSTSRIPERYAITSQQATRSIVISCSMSGRFSRDRQGWLVPGHVDIGVSSPPSS